MNLQKYSKNVWQHLKTKYSLKVAASAVLGALAAIVLGPVLPSSSGAKHELQTEALAQSDAVIRVLVADWCPYCRKLEAWLKENRMPYERLDIDRDPEAKEIYNRVGRGGIPISLIGNDMIRGFQKARIRQAWLDQKKKSGSEQTNTQTPKDSFFD